MNARRRFSPDFELPADASETIAVLLREHWRRFRHTLRRLKNKRSEKAIHQFRVEGRRLIARIELLSNCLRGNRKGIEEVIKGHLDLFDDLRDVQVQLQSVRKLKHGFTGARSFHAYLSKRERKLARQAFRQVKNIKRRTLDNCRARLKEIARELKRGAAAKTSGKLRKRMDTAFQRTIELRSKIEPSRPITIHRTRVAFKKFRYMLEALAEAVPELRVEKVFREMHDYQTLMGEIQDADVLSRNFEKFVEKKEIGQRRINSLREQLVRRREQAINAYLTSAGELDRFWE